MINVYELQDQNKRRSLAVIVFFVGFITLISLFLTKILGYSPGFIGLAFIIAGLMGFTSFWYGDKIILTFSGARPALKSQDFNFYTVTENLAQAAQIPMPRLFVIEEKAPNAFAAGRDPQHALICATRGLLEKLDRTELEGVIAHEISHIRNFDTRLMSLVTLLVGTVILLSNWLFRGSRLGRREKDDATKLGALLFFISLIFALLSPLIAQLIQLAISRRREFLADSSGVLLTRFPEGLAHALEKISADREPLRIANQATAHLFIVNPFKKTAQGLNRMAGLFNTHPPVEERIKILRQMA